MNTAIQWGSISPLTQSPAIAPPAGIAAPLQPGAAEANRSKTGLVEDSPFAAIFKSAIQNVKDTDAEFVNDQYLLATGQLDNPAQIGISGYKYEIAVDLLIQMRNKALDVYSELSRLSI